MRKFQKVFLTLLLVSVVCLTAGILIVENQDEDSISLDNNLKVSNLALEKTQLNPIVKYQIKVINSPEIVNPFNVLNDKDSFVYNGQGNAYNFKVEWEENVDVEAKIDVFKKDDTLAYQPFNEDIRNVGEYKVVISTTNEAYEVNPLKSELEFKITPYTVKLETNPETEFIYNKTSQAPILKTVEGSRPDTVFWKEIIQWYNPESKEYEPVTESVNVGKYMLKVKFETKNYIIENLDQVQSSEFFYEILPKELLVTPYLNDYTYSNTNKILLDKTLIEGIISYEDQDGNIQSDIVNVTFDYLYSNNEIKKDKVPVENIKDVGIYTLCGISDNPNYYLRYSYVEIHKKKINVSYVYPKDLVYDGNQKVVELKEDGLIKEDKITIYPTYNNKKDAPINAGEYKMNFVVEGDRKFNYDIKANEGELVIDKAQYPVDDFEVEIHAIKVIVITDDFKDFDVRFSLDNKTWQKEAKIEAQAMHDYVVYVKILEDLNHYEKLLTKEVRTGFDPVIFKGYMDEINVEDFSINDFKMYKEIIRCETYISEADKPSVDYNQLNGIKTAFLEYKDKAQTSLDGVKEIANSIRLAFVAPAVAVTAMGVMMVIRRRKDDKK